MKKVLFTICLLLALVPLAGCASGCAHGFLSDGPSVGTSRTVDNSPTSNAAEDDASADSSAG